MDWDVEETLELVQRVRYEGGNPSTLSAYLLWRFRDRGDSIEKYRPLECQIHLENLITKKKLELPHKDFDALLVDLELELLQSRFREILPFLLAKAVLLRLLKKYDACEEMRDFASLTEEEIDLLRRYDRALGEEDALRKHLTFLLPLQSNDEEDSRFLELLKGIDYLSNVHEEDTPDTQSYELVPVDDMDFLLNNFLEGISAKGDVNESELSGLTFDPFPGFDYEAYTLRSMKRIFLNRRPRGGHFRLESKSMESTESSPMINPVCPSTRSTDESNSRNGEHNCDDVVSIVSTPTQILDSHIETRSLTRYSHSKSVESSVSEHGNESSLYCERNRRGSSECSQKKPIVNEKGDAKRSNLMRLFPASLSEGTTTYFNRDNYLGDKPQNEQAIIYQSILQNSALNTTSSRRKKKTNSSASKGLPDEMDGMKKTPKINKSKGQSKNLIDPITLSFDDGEKSFTPQALLEYEFSESSSLISSELKKEHGSHCDSTKALSAAKKKKSGHQNDSQNTTERKKSKKGKNKDDQIAVQDVALKSLEYSSSKTTNSEPVLIKDLPRNSSNEGDKVKRKRKSTDSQRAISGRRRKLSPSVQITSEKDSSRAAEQLSSTRMSQIENGVEALHLEESPYENCDLELMEDCNIDFSRSPVLSEVFSCHPAESNETPLEVSSHKVKHSKQKKSKGKNSKKGLNVTQPKVEEDTFPVRYSPIPIDEPLDNSPCSYVFEFPRLPLIQSSPSKTPKKKRPNNGLVKPKSSPKSPPKKKVVDTRKANGSKELLTKELVVKQTKKKVMKPNGEPELSEKNKRKTGKKHLSKTSPKTVPSVDTSRGSLRTIATTSLSPSFSEQEKQDRLKTKKVMQMILMNCLEFKHSNLFKKPVTDLQAQNYHEVVHEPRDLEMIRRLVDIGHIINVDTFLLEYTRIFANACMYNSSNTEYFHCAKEMFEETIGQFSFLREDSELIQSVLPETPAHYCNYSEIVYIPVPISKD